MMKNKRGYWIPEGSLAYEGFYVKTAAVYTTGNSTHDWETFLTGVGRGLLLKDKTLEIYCEYRLRRFVLARNSMVEIVVEQCDGLRDDPATGYLAVFVIIPEDCEAPYRAEHFFNHDVEILKSTLFALYPHNVFERVNSQNIKETDMNKKRRRRRTVLPSE